LGYLSGRKVAEKKRRALLVQLSTTRRGGNTGEGSIKVHNVQEGKTYIRRWGEQKGMKRTKRLCTGTPNGYWTEKAKETRNAWRGICGGCTPFKRIDEKSQGDGRGGREKKKGGKKGAKDSRPRRETSGGGNDGREKEITRQPRVREKQNKEGQRRAPPNDGTGNSRGKGEKKVKRLGALEGSLVVLRNGREKRKSWFSGRNSRTRGLRGRTRQHSRKEIGFALPRSCSRQASTVDEDGKSDAALRVGASKDL